MLWPEWIERLNEYATEIGFRKKGEKLSDETGEECWLEFYEEGYSPEDALYEDLQAGL